MTLRSSLITAYFWLSTIVSLWAQGSWNSKANILGVGRTDAVAFAIGSKGYVGTGMNGMTALNDFWEWDQQTNAWTQKANFAGGARGEAVGFSIGNKGYIGTGGNYLSDFWEWDQSSNSWTQKSNFGGLGRYSAVGFSIGNKGYVGTGCIGNYAMARDFWEYDPATDNWIQQADLPGAKRYSAIGFSIGLYGYIGLGIDSFGESSHFCTSDFWEWNQQADVWIPKANYPGGGRESTVAFSMNARGYVGCGCWSNYGCSTVGWEWEQSTDQWTSITTYPGAGFTGNVGFSIGSKGYFGLGGNYSSAVQDFWEYSPTITTIDQNTPVILSFSIFPNPSSDFVGISFNASSPKETYTIRMINSLGECIYCEGFKGQMGLLTRKVDVSDVAKGIYFIELTSPVEKSTKKLILQ